MPTRGRRRGRLVLVVVVAVLVGCSGLQPGGPPTGAESEGVTPVTTGPGTPTVDSEAPRTPATTDRMGWENGYAANASLGINASDGLNRTELAAVVNRSMARVEVIRRIEFDRPVNVTVISRATFREEYVAAWRATGTEAARLNARMEALFLVGEDRNAVAVRQGNLAASVLGFYAPQEDRIALVAPGANASIPESVLAHELVHAYQFRHLGVGEVDRSTTDRDRAITGLIEGDARLVDRRYRTRCQANWSCVSGSGSGDGSGLHFGLYYLTYFPYTVGPRFVESAYEAGGWEAVDRLYTTPPRTSRELIAPSEDDPSGTVRLPDRSGPQWTPVGEPATDTLGQPAIAAMFVYTVGDGRPGVIVGTTEYTGPDGFRYDFAYADGWVDDTFRVYHNRANETGYVWRIRWTSPAEADEFATAYRELLRYWGAERVNRTPNAWRIPPGTTPFADAFRVVVSGDTVTIVNAPRLQALDAIHPAG